MSSIWCGAASWGNGYGWTRLFAAYVTDENGLLLHPGEVRERLIKGLPLVLNEDANWNHKTKQTKEGYLENYMAKNLYMLDAHLESRFETELLTVGKSSNVFGAGGILAVIRTYYL